MTSIEPIECLKEKRLYLLQFLKAVLPDPACHWDHEQKVRQISVVFSRGKKDGKDKTYYLIQCM